MEYTNKEGSQTVTDKDGKILPQCAAQLAVLEATGKQMNKAFGQMQQEFKTMTTNMQEQQVSVGKLTGNVDRLTTVVERLSDSLDIKVNRAVEGHEQGCVLYQAAKKKAERDITKRFRLTESSPPQNVMRNSESETDFDRKLKKLPKKVRNIIYVLLAVGTIVTSIAGYMNI